VVPRFPRFTSQHVARLAAPSGNRKTNPFGFHEPAGLSFAVTNKGPRTLYRNLMASLEKAPSTSVGRGLGRALYAACLGCVHTARRTEHEDTIHGNGPEGRIEVLNWPSMPAPVVSFYLNNSPKAAITGR
jgi:hypothetical protein